MINELKTVRFLTALDGKAKEAGVSIEMSTDFVHLQQLVDELDGRDPLSPIFDWRKCRVGAENAFWIKGVNDTGACVLLQAARIDDLGNKNLAEHIAENRDLIHTPYFKADTKNSIFDECYYLERITGRVVYAGETWISPNGPYRGGGLASVCSGFAFGLSLLRWRPDYMYGTATHSLMVRGIAAKYGYYHQHPKGLRWRRADGKGHVDEWIVWMDLKDLADATGSLETETPHLAADR
ncbi:hypothetical protein EOI86_15350 [Hwanghaeella grinnelliae]|uniref:GNAT family N-acetyltransferase n=1 Tax=Hwanghaeella grinnelliae TaxID=2500179 RepID=A0A3S2W9I9_9PROT|nr:hypothetical protein [Hwanghaeella grinnelliae]RVU36563.1 hypothetical protein EOI86_15350 [Hwanghaeella grinnelliae]